MMSQVSLEQMKKGLQCCTWVSQPVYLSNTFLMQHTFRWCTIVGFCFVAICQDLLQFVHFFKIHIIFRQETEQNKAGFLFHSSQSLMDQHCLQQCFRIDVFLFTLHGMKMNGKEQVTWASHAGKILYTPTGNLLTFDFQKQKQWHEVNCWKAEHCSL